MVNPNKTKVTISLKSDLWAKYKIYCRDNDLIPSYEIQKFIGGCLKK